MVEAEARDEGWRNAGDGWHGMEGKVRLQGWTRERRILVFRRRLREKLILEERDQDSGQIWLSGVELGKGKEVFEYAVLVTTLKSVDTLAVVPRPRGG